MLVFAPLRLMLAQAGVGLDFVSSLTPLLLGKSVLELWEYFIKSIFSVVAALMH